MDHWTKVDLGDADGDKFIEILQFIIDNQMHYRGVENSAYKNLRSAGGIVAILSEIKYLVAEPSLRSLTRDSKWRMKFKFADVEDAALFRLKFA